MAEVKNREPNAKSKYICIEQDTPKTNRSVRYIPLNNNAIDALEQLRKIIKDDKRVIASKNHTIPSPRKIYRTMESILRNCGITGKTNLVHALRHTFATTLIHSGVDIKAVSEILGHEDVSTTMNIYAHATREAKRNSARLLDKVAGND